MLQRQRLLANNANNVSFAGVLMIEENSNKGNSMALGEGSLESETVRNKKIMNLIANTNIILLSTLEDLADLLMTSMGAVASGMAGAIGGEDAVKEVDEELKQKLPEVHEKLKAVVSVVRQDVYLQIKQKRQDIEPLLSDPRFDDVLKIVDAYDFKLPKLTEELDDETHAAYLQLLISEDPKFNEMFKKLTSLMNAMQKPA
jgi:hypothetical protein